MSSEPACCIEKKVHIWWKIKSWVEVGGVYRYVEQIETEYHGVRKMGWRMVITRTRMTLTFEKESVIDGRASSYHEELEFEKTV